MNFDVFPILLTLAGVSIPTDRVIDGKNILSVLEGSHASPHDFLYFFDNEKITAVRLQRCKFVVNSYYSGVLLRFEGERNCSDYYYNPGLLFYIELFTEDQFCIHINTLLIV